MRYLTAEDVLLIHSLVIDQTGGSHGVRDLGIIAGLELQAEQYVFGKELHPTVCSKAALYTRNIIMSHPFVDGNKRTGMITAMTFLKENDFYFVAKKGEIEEFAIKVVIEKLTVEDISNWLKSHSQKGNQP